MESSGATTAKVTSRVRAPRPCAVASNMAGPTRAYLARRAEKVRVVGMRRVAEVSLANSFLASYAAERTAYYGIHLRNHPVAYAELSLALAQLELTPADWGAIRAPLLVASGAHDFLWPPLIGQQVVALVPAARFDVMEDAGISRICRHPRNWLAWHTVFLEIRTRLKSGSPQPLSAGPTARVFNSRPPSASWRQRTGSMRIGQIRLLGPR